MTENIEKRLLDLFVVFFGIWTVYCHLIILFEVSFTRLVAFSFLPFLGTALVLRSIWSNPVMGEGRKEGPQETGIGVQGYSERCDMTVRWILMIIVACLCVSYYMGIDYGVFWVGGVLVAAIILILSFYSEIPSKSSRDLHPRFVRPIVWFVTMLAVLITFLAVRPDADDAEYTSMVLQLVEQGDMPVFRYAPMYSAFDEPTPIIRKMHTYEVLVAYLSRMLGIPYLPIYYVALPCLFAALIFLAQWLILKSTVSSNFGRVVGICFLLLVFLTWGDSHRTYSNFALVRLFQGKSALVSLLVPLIYFYGSAFLASPSPRSWLLVLMTQVTATGLSINGIFLGPMTLVLLTISHFAVKRSIRLKIELGLAGAYPALLLVITKFYTLQVMSISHFGPNVSHSGIEHFVWVVLGEGRGVRGIIALFCLIICGLFVSGGTARRLLSAFVLVALIVLFNPLALLQHLLAENASYNLIWRTAWVCPMPMIMSIAVGSIACTSKKRRSRIAGFSTVAILVGVFTLAPQNWTVSPGNGTHLAIADNKLPPENYAVARELSDRVPPGSTLLAHEDLAAIMAALPKHPPLLIVRSLYLGRKGPAEREDLLFLLNVLSGREIDSKEAQTFVGLVNKYSVGAVVISSSSTGTQVLSSALKLEFDQTYTSRGYSLWLRRAMVDGKPHVSNLQN